MGLMRGIRKNVKGIYWVVVVVIVVTFVFWGTSVRPGRGAGYVGIVFDKKISRKEFRLQWLAARERSIRYELRTGQRITPEQVEDLAWQRIIRLHEAGRWGITVPADQVKEGIRRQFSRNDRFDEDSYRDYLESRGMSENDLAAMVRDDMRISQLERFVSGAIVAPPQELREQYDYENEQRKIKFHMIEVDSLLPAFEVSGEGEPYYRAHTNEFRVPRKAAVQYIMVEKGPFQDKISLTEEELKSYYEDNKSSYKGADGKAARFENVKSQIERHLKTQRAARLARQEAERVLHFSDASKMREVAEGNNLPLRITGLIPETGPVSDELAPRDAGFRKAAFDTPMGKVSPIIETTRPRGYCALSPIRIVPSRVPPLEEVRKKAAEKQRAQRLRQIASHAGVLPDQVETFVKEHSIIPADMDVTYEDALSYYENPSHKSDFIKEKKVKVQYLVLNEAPPGMDIKITRRDIEAEYANNKSKYKDENGEVKPLADVRKDIEKDLKARNAADEVFAVYRPQSMKQQALRYGLKLRESRLFAQGKTIDDYMGDSPIFASHAFQTDLGEVSATFSTEKGYCVLSPVRVVDEAVADFEEVAEEGAEKAKKGKAESLASRIAYALYRQVREKMTVGKKDFGTACKELGLEVEESGYFRRGDNTIEKVGATARQTQSIFQTEPGNVASPRRVEKGSFFYVVTEVKPPSDEEFAQDKERDYSRFAWQKAQEAFQEWAVALLRQANVRKRLPTTQKKATNTAKPSTGRSGGAALPRK